MGLELKNISLDWGEFPETVYRERTPFEVSATFIGGKISYYALLEDQTLPEDQKVSGTFWRSTKCKIVQINANGGAQWRTAQF